MMQNKARVQTTNYEEEPLLTVLARIKSQRVGSSFWLTVIIQTDRWQRKGLYVLTALIGSLINSTTEYMADSNDKHLASAHQFNHTTSHRRVSLQELILINDVVWNLYRMSFNIAITLLKYSFKKGIGC